MYSGEQKYMDVFIYFDTTYHPYGVFITKTAAEYPRLRIFYSFMEYYSDLCGHAVFEHGELVEFEESSLIEYCDEEDLDDSAM